MRLSVFCPCLLFPSFLTLVNCGWNPFPYHGTILIYLCAKLLIFSRIVRNEGRTTTVDLTALARDIEAAAWRPGWLRR